MMFYTTVESPIGELLLLGDGEALQALSMQDAPRPMQIQPHWKRDPRPFAHIADQLTYYFEGGRPDFDFPLAPNGSAFQITVWQALREIPYGTTLSYGELAKRLGYAQAANAARAVGTANGRNPIAVIVPCHRVIGADGSLTGYGGGIERKRLLLDLEAGVLSLGPGT
jgi:methylated-DNA-[protein]-cysteine S-methyltransferase